jgi:hypothetical protein
MAALGISARDSSGNVRSSVDVLADFADAIEQAGSSQEKLAIAADAFGSRIGSKLIPLLDDGADGFREWMRTAEAAGLVLSPELVQRADAASDAMATLQFAVAKGFEIGVVEGFNAEIGTSVETLTRAREAGEALGSAFGAMFSGLAAIGPLLSEANTGVRTLTAGLFDLADAISLPAKQLRFLIDQIARLAGATAAPDTSLEALAPPEIVQRVRALEVDIRKTFERTGDLTKATKELTAEQKRLAEAGKFLKETTAAEERLTRTVKERMPAQERFAQRSAQKEKGMLPPPPDDAEIQRVFVDPFSNALADVQNEFTRTFEQINTGGVRTFEDLADSAQDIFSNLSANLASLAIFDPEGFSALAQRSGLTGGQMLAATAVTTAAPVAAGAIGGQQAAQWASMGGAFGTAAGAAIGTWLLPGIGTVGGAILGGAAGSVLGGIAGLFGGGGKDDEPPSARDLSGRARPGHIQAALARGLDPLKIAGRIGQFSPEQQARNLENAIALQRTFEAFQLGPVNAQFRAIEHTFADLRAEAQRLGVSTAGLAEEQARANRELQRSLDAERFTLSATVGAMDDFSVAMHLLNLNFQQAAERAQELGIPTANLTREHQRLADAMIREHEAALDAQALSIIEPFERLLDPLRQFADELQFEGLNPAGQMQAAQEEFRRIAELARAGSSTAIEQLEGAGRAFIQQAERFGASPGSAAARTEVASVIESVMGDVATAQREASQGVEEHIDRASQRNVDTLNELKAEVRILVEEVKRNGRR